MEDTSYYVVNGFMINQLHLKNTELMVYAIIHSFSQNQNGFYVGSLEEIAKWTNSSKRNAKYIVDSLVDRGLIRKEYFLDQNNTTRCMYQAIGGWKYTSTGGGNTLPQGVEKSDTISQKQEKVEQKEIKYSSFNNNIKENNINIIKEKNCNYFKKPTVDEIKEYCKERQNNVDANTFYDFYESKGWLVGKVKMKDWKACVRTWEKYRQNNKEDLSYMNPDPVPNLRVGSFKDLEDYMNPDPVENLPIVNIDDL